MNQNFDLGISRILMIGEGAVGKTSLTLQFMYGDFIEEYEPTKADSYRKRIPLDIVLKNSLQLQSGSISNTGGNASKEEQTIDILDTAGQEEYASIRDNYYRSGEGFMLVFSITERESFDHLIEFRDQIIKVWNATKSLSNDTEEQNIEQDQIPMLLVGNKKDLQHMRQVSIEDARKRAEQWGIQYIETSAKTKEGVEIAYYTLVNLIRAYKLQHSYKQSRQSIRQKCLLM